MLVLIICSPPRVCHNLSKWGGFSKARWGGPLIFQVLHRGMKQRRRRRRRRRKCDCRRRKKSNCWKQLWFHQDPEPWETEVRRDERCGGDAGRHIWGINWKAQTLLLGLGRRDEKIWGGGKKARARLARSDAAAAAGREARWTLVRPVLQRAKIQAKQSAWHCKHHLHTSSMRGCARGNVHWCLSVSTELTRHRGRKSCTCPRDVLGKKGNTVIWIDWPSRITGFLC